MIGEVSMLSVTSEGIMEVTEVGRNRIMNLSKARAIASIYYDAELMHPNLLDPVTELRFGSGGMDGPTTKSVDGFELGLYTPHVGGYTPESLYKDIENVDLSKTSVTYGFTLDFSDLVGQNISEMGLFTRSGKLFAMKTFDEVPKDGSFALVINWRIQML